MHSLTNYYAFICAQFYPYPYRGKTRNLSHTRPRSGTYIIKPQLFGIPISIPDSRKSGEFTLTLYSDGYVTRSSTSLLRTTARLSFRTKSEIIGDETNSLLCANARTERRATRTERARETARVSVVVATWKCCGQGGSSPRAQLVRAERTTVKAVHLWPGSVAHVRVCRSVPS